MLQLHRVNSFVNQRTNRTFECDFLFLAQLWHSGQVKPAQSTATVTFDQTSFNLIKEVAYGIHS
jgi:hypothetical protein